MAIPFLAIFDVVGKVIDRVLPDKAAADAAKLKLLELQQAGELKEFEAQAEIIKTEAASSHWLAANWRPLTALIFVGLIVARWLGWTAPGMTESEYIAVYDIIQIMIGGYVVSRGIEKIAPTVADVVRKK